MSSFKNILFPINGSQQALDYAIMMAKKSYAKLHFLKTYRLTDTRGDKSLSAKSIKDSLYQQLVDEFESTYKSRLEESGINYDFKVEIGFLTDRILAAIEDSKIDMLLINSFQKSHDDSIIERIQEVSVPVMLIPEKALAAEK
jgi:hypothetical protein